MVGSVLFLQFLPLMGAIVMLFFPQRKKGAAGILALIFALSELIFSISLFSRSIVFKWSLALGVNMAFSFDALSVIVLSAMSGATAVAILYSLRAQQKPEPSPSFYSLILLVLFGTTGVALARDLIQFYVFWEAMLIPAWVLVIKWNEESSDKVRYIGLKFFIITHIGAVLMLSSILWIYSLAGTTNMDSLIRFLPTLPLNVLVPMTILFLMGFIVKLAIFPFHTWLPDAYTSSVTAVTLVLAGVMTAIGIYGFARFLPFFPGAAASAVSVPLLILALITMFYGGLMALTEKNIKRIVAFSSVSQMGYVLFGFATMLPAGIAGSIFNIFNQAASKLALFVCVGIVAEKSGTYLMDNLGGWAKRLPLVAVCSVGAALSIAGAPPALGFWPEFLTFSAGFAYGKYIIVSLALAASVISAAYSLRLIRFVFFGPLKEGSQGGILDTGRVNSVILVLLFLFILILGVYPAPAFKLVHQAVSLLGFKL
jgi:proton-translocating NADH-quinone oxidoreductase chain M